MNKNNLAITETEKEGTRYIKLDTAKSTFRHFQWKDLGDFGKQKCDNFIFLTSQNEQRKKIKIIYI